MLLALPVGPGLVEGDFLLEGNPGELGGDVADALGRETATVGHRFGGVVVGEVLLGHELEDGARALVAGGEVGHGAGLVEGHRLAGLLVDDQRLSVLVAQEQTLVRPLRFVHQEARVGVAAQVVEIDLAGAEQLVDQGQDEEPVGAGRDADPFVGDGVVARADRVHAHDLAAIGLELADADLDRVTVVVFGHAEQHEELGAVPVGLAEFPEGTAHGVDPAGGHVDRAEAAVGRVVGRAESLAPEAGEALRLVAAGEKSQLFRGCIADRLEPADGDLERLVPGDFFEFTRPARADPLERRAQPRGGGVLHDPRRAFAAEHALVDRVVAVALDVDDLFALHVHVDAAAAGAHVAGGLADLVGDRRRGLDLDVFGPGHDLPSS